MSYQLYVLPSDLPYLFPSVLPTFFPSVLPSFLPSVLPSFLPYVLPFFLFPAAAARPLPPHVHGRSGAKLEVAFSQEEQEPGHGPGGGSQLPGQEHTGQAGLLEQQTQARPVAQDLRGDADVLEEPAHGVLRLQVQELETADAGAELAVVYGPGGPQAQHLPAGRGGGGPRVAHRLQDRQ